MSGPNNNPVAPKMLNPLSEKMLIAILHGRQLNQRQVERTTFPKHVKEHNILVVFNG